MGIEIMGASDDLLEVEGDIREEFNVLGDDDLFIAASNGLLYRVEYDRDGVWRFRPYTNGSGTITHKECAVGDPDIYSDVLIVEDVTIEWVLVGTKMARVRRERAPAVQGSSDTKEEQA